MKKVIVIGAGPAGLTAAYELLDKSSDCEVTVLEESNDMGGICKTVSYKGNRMDMGGHRFFSKVDEVNEWWNRMLPLQGRSAADYKQLRVRVPLVKGGPDPNKEDRVMLTRRRVSRIFFKHKFFDYPISLKFETIANMGFFTTMQVGFSYLASVIHKREEKSLEDFYINRFGKKLYSMFFERYTENLWGRHPSVIAPDWGSQRVKGLSIMAILKDMFGKLLPKRKGAQRHVETSLIEEFKYPKLGPGQLWDVTADEIRKKGGKILTGHHVIGLHKDENNILRSVEVECAEGKKTLEADVVISSMPVKDLVHGMNDVPEDMRSIAEGLPYRDYITLGVLIPTEKLLLKNKTKMKTISNIIPDNWVYVHDKGIEMGRFQLYNNWSPYMVKDLEHTVWIGLEYFCQEGEKWWNMSEEEFARFAIKDMIRLGIIADKADVLDYHEEKVKKAYPAYFDTYSRMDELVEYLSSIENLYCVGRNGQHRYNNLDHSMCTSFEAVKNILNGTKDKSNIWAVNTESGYHESK
ncbi:MAG: NAD(P)/FAD-dependent oxidoreductase [Lachnospiraceae bacterium]|nr:NAD(P)/FAD-dependent oxidoreductase [Lachnospiraceae bacterium]